MHYLRSLLLFITLALPVVTQAASEKTTHPNILFITIDDLNTDIGVMGGPSITPNIDRLAEEGVLFTDAHCNSPVCGPSRASFLTGLLPDTLDYYNHNNKHFRDTPVGAAAVTLPQYFAKHGYETASAGKVFHNGRGDRNKPSRYSDPQSWQYQYRNGHGVAYEVPKDTSKLWHKGKLGKNAWPARQWVWDSVDVDDEETGDWQNADFGAKFLQEKHDKPFFLAIGIFRPHVPFIAPQKYFDMYPLDSIERPEVLENDLDDVGPTGRKWAQKANFHKWITHFDQWEKAIQAYRASSSFADACVGHLIDALNASPYADDTIIVLLSDHGFHLGEKSHWAKFTFWDTASRVPLIIRMPNNQAGIREQTVSLVDLYPTLIDLAGLPQKEGLEGTSLRPLLEDPDSEDSRNVHMMFAEHGHEAIITDDWRYIRYKDGFEELYDRKEDPNDWHNLASNSDYAQTVEMMRAKLRTSL